jgi:hypothetical protein
LRARNRLTDIAFALATGKSVNDDESKPLLHIAGESATPIPLLKRFWATLLVFLLYLLVPMLALVIYLLIHNTST